jgi:FG-GAP repeat
VRNHRFTAMAASVLLLTGAAITAASSAGAAVPPPATHDDFNGDGYPDLVVGAPSATVSGHKGAGYIAVLYGSAKGLSTADRSVIDQSSAGVPGTPEAGDNFGAATASADFDGDGYPDLAVAAPHEAIGSTASAGGVTVLWGSADGLTGDSTWIQDDTPVANGLFGRALAAGDFDGDGHQELAVLTSDTLWTYTFVADAASAGPRITRSSAARAMNAARAHATAGADDARSAAADGVHYTGMTAGDYNDDHLSDLVLLGTSVISGTSHGLSSYLPGSADGPTWSRDLAGGPVAASGDLNGDGADDLATAYPTQSGSSGTVKIWYGGADGPSGKTGPDDPVTFSQSSAGVPGTAESGDHWGSDLSIGDANGDQHPDLAIGADGEDIGSVSNAGAVWLLRGSATGITGTGAQSFDQNSANVPGDAETSDRFGGQVRLIDADADGKAGLVAAAPGENTNDGVAWVLSGTASGLTATGSWTFGGGSVNAPSADAQFGSTIEK